MKYKYFFSKLFIMAALVFIFPSASSATRNISVEIEGTGTGTGTGVYSSLDTFYVVIKVDDAADIVLAEMVLDYDLQLFNLDSNAFDIGGDDPPNDGMFGYPVTVGDETLLPSRARYSSETVTDEDGNIVYGDDGNKVMIGHLHLHGAAIADDGGGKHTGEQVLFRIPFNVNADKGDSHSSCGSGPIDEKQTRFKVRQFYRCIEETGWHNDLDGDEKCDNGEEVVAPVFFCAARNTDSNWGDLTQAFYSTDATFINAEDDLLAETAQITVKPLSMEITSDPEEILTTEDYTVTITGDDGPFEYRYYLYGQYPGDDEGWADYTGAVTVSGTDGEDNTYVFEGRVKNSPDYTMTLTFAIDRLPPVVQWAYSWGAPISGNANDDNPVQSKQWYFTVRESEEKSWRYAIDQNENAPDPWDEDEFFPGGTTFTRSATKTGADGKWYIHVQSKDAAGNNSEIITCYAILDNTPPAAPSIATAEPAQNTATSARAATLTWNLSTDAHNGLEENGIAGYSWVLDTTADTTPDDTTEGTDLPSRLQLPSDGNYYIHAKTVDKAGNWSDVYHYGPWTTGPVVPGDVDGSGKVDLADAIFALKILAGISDSDVEVYADAEISGDSRVGIEEAIYALQHVANL